MAGIAGIARPGKRALVGQMLDRLAHRGRATCRIIDTQQATLGVVAGPDQPVAETDPAGRYMVCDCGGNERLASAQVMGDKLTLVRDSRPWRRAICIMAMLTTGRCALPPK